MTDKEFARNFVNDHCIARVPPGSHDLPSYKAQGTGYYRWQFYPRAALYHPVILNLIVRDLLDVYEDAIKAGYQLCGVEAASSPILTGALLECHRRGYDANIFSIRKEQKPYGLCNWIEGRYYLNKPALLVDDVTSERHKTTVHAAKILAMHHVPIAPFSYTFIFKTKTPDMKIKLEGQTITVASLFNLNDFDLYLEDYHKRQANSLTL